MYNDCQCHADLPCLLLSYGSTMGEGNPSLLIEYFEIFTSILESL